MKAFSVQSSDLSGGLNPTGVWSPEFLLLKRAVETRAPVGQLEHALYAWSAARRITEPELDALLELPPEEAVAEFATKLRLGSQTGRISEESLPLVQDAFRRVYTARVQRAAKRLEQDYLSGMTSLGQASQRHGLNVPAQAAGMVEALLA